MTHFLREEAVAAHLESSSSPETGQRASAARDIVQHCGRSSIILKVDFLTVHSGQSFDAGREMHGCLAGALHAQQTTRQATGSLGDDCLSTPTSGVDLSCEPPPVLAQRVLPARVVPQVYDIHGLHRQKREAKGLWRIFFETRRRSHGLWFCCPGRARRRPRKLRATKLRRGSPGPAARLFQRGIRRRGRGHRQLAGQTKLLSGAGKVPGDFGRRRLGDFVYLAAPEHGG